MGFGKGMGAIGKRGIPPIIAAWNMACWYGSMGIGIMAVGAAPAGGGGGASGLPAGD